MMKKLKRKKEVWSKEERKKKREQYMHAKINNRQKKFACRYRHAHKGDRKGQKQMPEQTDGKVHIKITVQTRALPVWHSALALRLQRGEAGMMTTRTKRSKRQKKREKMKRQTCLLPSSQPLLLHFLLQFRVKKWRFRGRLPIAHLCGPLITCIQSVDVKEDTKTHAYVQQERKIERLN